MNFLQLVQATHRLLRADNNKLGTAPTTVAGQESLLDELAFFIAQSWQDIQNEQQDWRWMFALGTLTLPQGLDTISPSAISDFDSFKLSTHEGTSRFLTMYRDSIADEVTIRFVPYEAWRQSYLERGDRGIGQPGNFTIQPNNDIRFDMVADFPYTVRFGYRKSNQTLTDDADIPAMPIRHHMAIVWWAITRYYCTTREGAEKFREKTAVELRREMQKLRNEQTFDPMVLEDRL